MSISSARVVDEDPDLVDQLVILHGVSWQAYELLLRARGESAVPRLTYLEGTLELMSPGFTHEIDKKTLARSRPKNCKCATTKGETRARRDGN